MEWGEEEGTACPLKARCSQLWQTTAGYTHQDGRSHALCQGCAVGEEREGLGPSKFPEKAVRQLLSWGWCALGGRREI